MTLSGISAKGAKGHGMYFSFFGGGQSIEDKKETSEEGHSTDRAREKRECNMEDTK